MADFTEAFSASFVPMAASFLAEHPYLVLIAYVLLKGLDRLQHGKVPAGKKSASKEAQENPSSSTFNSEPTPTDFVLSDDEIADHYS